MNTACIDPVFGEMIYSHSWSRQETISWWGTRKVKISAKAFKDEDITNEQRKAFHEYKDTIGNFIDEALPKIYYFLVHIYEYNVPFSLENLREILRPQTVLFLRDGTWGILFDSNIDIENGLGVFKINGQITVGTQEEFI